MCWLLIQFRLLSSCLLSYMLYYFTHYPLWGGLYCLGGLGGWGGGGGRGVGGVQGRGGALGASCRCWVLWYARGVLVWAFFILWSSMYLWCYVCVRGGRWCVGDSLRPAPCLSVQGFNRTRWWYRFKEPPVPPSSLTHKKTPFKHRHEICRQLR